MDTKECIGNVTQDEALLQRKHYMAQFRQQGNFGQDLKKAQAETNGLTVNTADLYLLIKEDETGLCMMVIYIDDILLVDHPEAIQDTKEKIKTIFKIKEDETLEDNLGVRKVKNHIWKKSMVRTTYHH